MSVKNLLGSDCNFSIIKSNGLSGLLTRTCFKRLSNNSYT